MKAMPNVLIRELPEEVHERLKQKASAEGMSLQSFLVRLLEAEAERPIRGEWAGMVERRLIEAGAKPGDFPPEEILETIDQIRRERDEHYDRLFSDR